MSTSTLDANPTISKSEHQLVAQCETRQHAASLKQELIDAGIPGDAMTIYTAHAGASESAHRPRSIAAAIALGLSAGVFAGGIIGLAIFPFFTNGIAAAVAVFSCMAVGALLAAVTMVVRFATTGQIGYPGTAAGPAIQLRVDPPFVDKAREIVSSRSDSN